jgi:SAM-dependent methyltransferase
LADLSSTAGYAAEADALAVEYERLTFDRVHGDILHLLPPAPAMVLDIGAGTGRDAAALTARGYRVTAVEPTAAMRGHGQRLHADNGIVWLEDGLPDLAQVDGRFDLILLTAVWMHLDAAERQRAMPRLAALVAPGGLVAMTLRHGPVPPGRRMFDVGGAETAALGGQHDLQAVFETRRPSARQSGIDWTRLVLRRP